MLTLNSQLTNNLPLLQALEVERLRCQMISLYENNAKRPFPMLQLICDRTSFAKTVENTFHLHFMVKDGNRVFCSTLLIALFPLGTVKLWNVNSRMMVAPTKAKPIVPSDANDATNAANKQSILKLDFVRWQTWCKQLNRINSEHAAGEHN